MQTAPGICMTKRCLTGRTLELIMFRFVCYCCVSFVILRARINGKNAFQHASLRHGYIPTKIDVVSGTLTQT